MTEAYRTLTASILQLAARDGGAVTADLTALGYTQEAVSRATHALRKTGRLWSFKRSGGAQYHATEEAYAIASAEWNAGAKERLRARERDKYAKKKETDPAWIKAKNARVLATRARRMAAAEPKPRQPKKPREYKVTPNQKPAFPATVTIKSSARGPAYLPGEPDYSKAKRTYGASPQNPTRTNTHAE
jgi:hypothetical protein